MKGFKMTNEEMIKECCERYGLSDEDKISKGKDILKTRKFDYENFLAELEEYKNRPENLEHDLCVPRAYINERTGYKLGLEVGRIRAKRINITEEERVQLSEMGFVFDAKSFDFENFKQELIKFKETHKDKGAELRVPAKYVNEENGYKLGQKVVDVKCAKIKTTDVQKTELREMGVDLEVKKLARFDFGVFVKELNAYKNLPNNTKHDLHVPKSYVNKDTGYKLGKIVTRVRAGDIHTTISQQSKLDEIGFEWAIVGKKFNFEEFVTELDIYKTLHKDLSVPAGYINQETGYKLGYNVKCMRSGNIEMTEEQFSQLSNMGFAWETKKFDFDIFKLELLKYKNDPSNLNHDLLVPQAYIDEETGYKLGRTVGSVRSGNVRTDEDQRQELDEIGFIWNVYEYNRNLKSGEISAENDSQMGDE